MQRVHYEKRQGLVTNTAVPSAAGISGGETATSAATVESSLLLGSSTPTVSDLFPTDSGIVSTSTPTSDITPTSSSSNHSSSSSVSTGSAVAMIVAGFLVLIGAMFIIYKYVKKRIASQARRPISRGPPRGIENSRDYGKDKQRDDGNGRVEGKNRSPPGVLNITGTRDKSLDSGKFALFEKEPSIRTVTDEKANVSDDHHFDPSTMATFARYQADPTGDLPHPRPLAAREEGSPAVSWDGRTVISDQFLSLHGSVSDAMSPTSVIARQTPQTTDSAQHRWESAEVLMMDEHATESPSASPDASQNPFSDDSSPRRSAGGDDSETRSGANPFFNASQHNPFAERSTRSRASSVSTAKRSRSYSISSGATVRAGESENALFSLLAALDPARGASDEPTYRSSMQTTATSIYPPSESGDVPQAF